MTHQQLALSWDDKEVRTFSLYRMTHHLGPGHGYEWKATCSNQFNAKDQYGNIVGDCWGYAVRPTAEEAWEGAFAHMRQMVTQRLESQNAKPRPVSRGLEPEVITTSKGLEDMGL